MKIVLLHNHYDQGHLNKVIKKMKTLGAPVIQAYHLWDDLYQAIGGCHRLRAAEILGVTPIIEVIDAKTTIWSLGLDAWDDYDENETIDLLGDWENYTVEIDE